MRIVIVADAYPPLRTSAAIQLRDLAREFALQGHEPTVIAPGGARQPVRLVREHGVTVLRCPTPPTKDIGYVRRTINEMRLPYALLRSLHRSELCNERWDGVVCYSPSIFLGPMIRALRRISRCPSYLILRDIFPEWAVDMGLMRKGPGYYFFKMVQRSQYAAVDIIGVQTSGNLSYLSHWSTQPGRTLEVLHNWLSDEPDIGCRISIANSLLAGRKIFAYTGNMGVAQGVDVFLDLATRLRERPDVGFLFVGRGSDAARLSRFAASRRLANVIFHDEIDPTEIPGLLAQCHVGLVALDPRHKTHNIPGKFLAYMRAGIPVLASINPNNDLEKLIKDERVGRVCTEDDGATLQPLAEQLVADTSELAAMGQRARSLSKRLFSSRAAAQQIAASLFAGIGSGDS